jgi:hypothetical protein
MSSARRTDRLAKAACALVALLGAFASPGTARATNTPNTSRAFVRLELPKRTAYVGESLPVTIRAFYRDDTGVTVKGAPALSSADFTLHGRDPEQSRAVIDGVGYLVVTWKDHLSPVKAGKYALSIDVPSTLEWRSAPPPSAAMPSPDPFGGDPFGDSSLFAQGGGDPFAQMQQRMQALMNHAFADADVGAVRRQDVVLRAPVATLDVREVPAAGRPPEFSGAVGHFTMTASADPTRTRTGEPITLALRVEGTGGFDRVRVAGLPGSSDWKTYSPSAAESEGEKTFKQPLVALHAGITAIPSASFSFFDPDAARFVSVSTAPIPIEVAPGAAIAASSSGKTPEATSGPTLAPNADGAGRPRASLAPGFTQRWVWAAQGAAFATLGAAALLALRRRTLAADLDGPRRREARRVIEAHRAAMDRALAARDGTAFFAEARGALQQTLGARWHLEPSAISLTEIEARLDPTEASKLRPVFDADAARFSGQAVSMNDLPGCKATLDRELHRLSQPEAS